MNHSNWSKGFKKPKEYNMDAIESSYTVSKNTCIEITLVKDEDTQMKVHLSVDEAEVTLKRIEVSIEVARLAIVTLCDAVLDQIEGGIDLFSMRPLRVKLNVYSPKMEVYGEHLSTLTGIELMESLESLQYRMLNLSYTYGKLTFENEEQGIAHAKYKGYTTYKLIAEQRDSIKEEFPIALFYDRNLIT